MTVAFVHIPKTAGGVIHRIGLLQYPLDRTVRLPDDERLHDQLLATPKWRQAIQDAEYFSGHFSMRAILYESAVFTLLRDPVDRLLSHYFYMRDMARADSPARRAVREGMSLIDYVRHPPVAEVDNGQVRHLLYDRAYGSMPHDGPIGDVDVQLAVENLDQLVLVGLQERFDETVELIVRMFSWSIPAKWPRANRNPLRPRVEDLPKDTLRILRNYTEPGRFLYQAAKARFADQFGAGPLR